MCIRDRYRNDLADKCEEFAYRPAEEGVAIAQIHIGSSGYGKHITLDSEMKIEGIGCRAIIFMEDAQKDVYKRQDEYEADRYSEENLRQIAEHLLVYCNHTEAE